MYLTPLIVVVFSLVFQFIHAQKKAVLFTAGNEAVSAEEFIYLFRKNHPDKTTYESTEINEYLDLYIQFKLKVAEAKSRGLDTTAAFQREFTQYRQELRKPYLPETKAIDSMSQAVYQRMKEEVSAAHILIGIPPDQAGGDTLKAYEEIMRIRTEILNGGDFGTLAARYSADPSAKFNQGQLGYFTALQMVYPFEQAAYSLHVGEISKPVRTRFGYHLIKLNDRRPSSGKVEVAHIMIRVASEQDEVTARNKIFEAHDKLRAGMAWDEVCNEYSGDSGTKSNGGKLKPFGVGEMGAVQNFEGVAFSLSNPGDISDPFKTQYGWHIVKLLQKIPLPSYPEMAASIKGKLMNDERVMSVRKQIHDEVKKKVSFKEQTTIKDSVFNAADSTLQKGKFSGFKRSLKNEVLFSTDQRKYTVDDFDAFIKLHGRPSNIDFRKYIELLYNQFVDESIMQRWEREIISAKPEFGFLLREYYEGILLFDIMEKEVWSKASQDSLGQVEFYENNKMLFQAGDRALGKIFISTNGQAIDHLAQLAGKGSEAEANAFALEQKIKMEGGYLKKGDRPVLSEVPWRRGVHRLEKNGSYYLIWLKEILGPGVMSFQESRADVISKYQASLEKAWVEKLKKKFAVKVNAKQKKRVTDELETKSS